MRVWVVDPETMSITVFFPDDQTQLYTGNTKIVAPLLSELELTPQMVFEEAELL